MLVLYGYLIRALGIAAMGVWSVLSALTAIGRIGEAGLSMGLTRNVAMALANHNEAAAARFVQTAIISLLFSVSVIVLLAFPFLEKLITVSIAHDGRQLALELLPFSAVSFILLLLGTTLCGALDGTQRVDLRNAVVVVGSVSLVFASFIFVPLLGLRGVIYAQLLQGFVVIALSWKLLRRRIRKLPWIPYKWNAQEFKWLFGFGAGIQAMQISGAIADAVVKSAISAYGGLATVGIYEMASKYAGQLRALLVLPTQVMLPAVVAAQAKSEEAVDVIYGRAVKTMLFLSVPYHSFAIATTPILVFLWAGESMPRLRMYIAWLLIASAINSIANPAYFSYLGIGRIRWLVVANIVIAFVTCIGTTIVGNAIGANGVVGLAACSFALGSLIMPAAFHKERSFRLRNIVSLRDLWTAALSVTGSAISFVIFGTSFPRSDQVSSILLGVLTIIVFIVTPIGMHPMRREVFSEMKNAFRNKTVKISESRNHES